MSFVDMVNKMKSRQQSAKGMAGNMMPENFNPEVKNRFDNYQPQFGYDEISSLINSLFDTQENDIRMEAAGDKAMMQKDTAQRLSSQGITKGSVFNDAVKNAGSGVAKGKFSALSKLKTARAGALPDLQMDFNRMGIQTDQMAQNTDFGNIDNLFKKYGLGMQGMQMFMNNQQEDDNDFLAFLDTISPLAGLL